MPDAATNTTRTSSPCSGTLANVRWWAAEQILTDIGTGYPVGLLPADQGVRQRRRGVRPVRQPAELHEQTLNPTKVSAIRGAKELQHWSPWLSEVQRGSAPANDLAVWLPCGRVRSQHSTILLLGFIATTPGILTQQASSHRSIAGWSGALHHPTVIVAPCSCMF